MLQCFATRIEFWQHSSRDDLLLFESRYLRKSQPTHDVAIRTFDARDIGQKDKCVCLGGDGTGGSHLVCIDVVVLAVKSQCHRRDDGNGAHRPDGIQPAWICCCDLADKAKIGDGLFLASTEDMAISARKSDRCLAVRS